MIVLDLLRFILVQRLTIRMYFILCRPPDESLKTLHPVGVYF